MNQDTALEILKSGVNVFLTGEPGSGKSYTIGKFKEWMDSNNKSYAVTASTGIAASLIDGVTIHSWTGLGIRRNLRQDQVEDMRWNSYVAMRVSGVDVLIIDEISMLDAVAINDINNILCIVRGDSRPFGGVQIVFVGDFFQLPPVTKEGEQKQFAFESTAWLRANPVVCYLDEQHRQDDPVFLDILTSMRRGEITSEHKAILRSAKLEETPDTQLFTHNSDVDHLNRQRLSLLDGPEQVYDMTSYGPDKLVEGLKKNCLSPERLILKKGAVVMFTRNNPIRGFVNGTIGKVVDFRTWGPVVELLDGTQIVPDRAEWEFKEGDNVKAAIKQIPLRLAWAITVHKSQGMSLDAAKIDLTHTFEYGQGYVAISRVRSLKGLHIIGVNDEVFKMHPKVVAQDKKFRELEVSK